MNVEIYALGAKKNLHLDRPTKVITSLKDIDEASPPSTLILLIEKKLAAADINWTKKNLELGTTLIYLIRENCLENVTDKKNLIELNRLGLVFCVLNSSAGEKEIDSEIKKHLERIQEDQVIKMMYEHLNELANRNTILESSLTEEQNKTKTHLLSSSRQTTRTETHQSALLEIHKSLSVAELEKNLLKSLAAFVSIEKVTVNFSAPNFSAPKNLKNAYALSTIVDGKPVQIVFHKSDKKPFSSSQINLLSELDDSIALALKRIQMLQRAERISLQWSTTFDSFVEAICILDNEQRVVMENKSFQSIAAFVTASDEFNNILQKESSLTQEIKLKNEDIDFHFQVTCHSLPIQRNGLQRKFKIIFLRDISEEKRLERQVVESSKLTDLGLIGSSIAHELNNPIGGMLSYLQLIKMGMAVDDKHRPEILEMEAATLKCKDLVEKLLGFSRKSSGTKGESVSLENALQSAIDLIEVKSKYHNIKISFSTEGKHLSVSANQNELVQAFKNILQNSLEAILSKQKDMPQHSGEIKIEIADTDEETYQVSIIDNGVGMSDQILGQVFNPLFSTKKKDQHSGLGLTVAYQILKDSSAKVEFSSQANIGTRVKIAFQRLDLVNDRQVFDSQI